MAIERTLLYGLAGLLVAAPLPFGAVQGRWSAALVAASAVLGLLWIAWRSRRGLRALPWREPVLLAALAFAAVAMLQIVPMPRAAVAGISPTAAALRADLEPPAAHASAEPARSGWRPLSLYPWATRQSLLRFLACILATLITIDLAATERSRKVLIGALVAGGAFQAAYGLAEYLTGRQQIFAYVKKYYVNMATGTFINKNHYAGYLEMILPFALALAVSLFPKMRPSPRGGLLRRLAEAPGKDLFSVAVAMLLALLMATALVASRSRAGIACALAALLAVGAVMSVRRSRAGFAVAAALAVIGTVVLFSQESGVAIVDQFRRTPQSMTGVVGRWSMWRQTAAMISAFPAAGVGLGAFEYVLPGYRTEAAGVFLSHAHNDYLELVAEAGILGAAVFAAGAIFVGASLLRRRPRSPGFGPFGQAAAAGVLAVALHSLVDFNLAIPANALTFSVLVGLLVAWRRPPAPVLATDASPRRGWAARAVAPALALLVVAATAMAPVVAGAPEEEPPGLEAPAEEASPVGSLAWLLDGDNADRLFDEAAARGRVATMRLQLLQEARLDGREVPATETDFVGETLRSALALEDAGIRAAPTYPRGHLYRGHLRAAICALDSLGKGGGDGCATAGIDDLRNALRLAPMSASMHAQVARYYIHAWPLLDAPTRREALSVIERASRMNRSDKTLRQALETARKEVRG